MKMVIQVLWPTCLLAHMTRFQDGPNKFGPEQASQTTSELCGTELPLHWWVKSLSALFLEGMFPATILTKVTSRNIAILLDKVPGTEQKC